MALYVHETFNLVNGNDLELELLYWPRVILDSDRFFLGSFIMSAHLTWMIIRNNNAYLLKKRNVKKPFSTEQNNLTNLSSFRHSGLIHKKSVGIVAAPDNKGYTVVYKKSRASVS